MVLFYLIFLVFYLDGFTAEGLIKSKVISLLDDLITYLIIGIILGGRLGYVLFYNLNYLKILLRYFLYGKVECHSTED